MVQLIESKNLCKQNVKWKPTVFAHFYTKLKFGSLNTLIQLIPNSEKNIALNYQQYLYHTIHET